MTRRAEMLAKAQLQVMRSTTWLNSLEFMKLTGLDADEFCFQVEGWKSEGMLFSVTYQRAEYYPAYAIDTQNLGRPITDLKLILKEFKGTKSGWGLAFWFTGVNSFLGAMRPQDLLRSDPLSVRAAAKDEMIGIQHG